MVMKKLVLQKVVTLAAAALALGSAFIANDALAHALSSGAGGDHIGSGFPGAHMGAFPSGRIGGDFHAGLRDNHESGRISRPLSMATTGIRPKDSTAGNRKTFPPMPLGACARPGTGNAISRPKPEGAATERRSCPRPLLEARFRPGGRVLFRGERAKR